MALTDTLRVGKGELQAQSQTILGCAGQMDQTLAQTQSRVQSLLDSWLGLGANAFSDLFAQWHSAAQQCHDSLTAIASRLQASGQAYDEQDQSVAAAIRSQ
ncbi:MAG: WXG100 family type VII secretion target [Candidatus Dormiibacterota bacterium]